MNTISINGVTITQSGSVVVSNGKVFVNGKDVTPDAKEVNIEISGNVEKLHVDACTKVSIKGDAGVVSTTSGDVEIGGNVSGSVQTVSGDVDCGNIGGSVSTVSGDIKHRRNF